MGHAEHSRGTHVQRDREPQPLSLVPAHELYVPAGFPPRKTSQIAQLQPSPLPRQTGLSMGGHGGLFLGWRHSDFFGACGSMSGALDISVITRGYGMDKILGDTITNRKNYEIYSFMHEMQTPPKQPLKITIDCGTEDPIFFMTKNVHEKMKELKIVHDYTERPGKHDWPYWSNAVQYQLLFFSRFFRGE